jgi:hypothetical protein
MAQSKYQSSGTTSFVAPAGVYKVKVECWGGGGNGGDGGGSPGSGTEWHPEAEEELTPALNVYSVTPWCELYGSGRCSGR